MPSSPFPCHLSPPHCPCSASVDEQLEPLATFIKQAGGSPAAVLLTCPGIAAVPVAHLKGARHVLRQLGVTGAHSAACLPAALSCVLPVPLLRALPCNLLLELCAQL